MSRKAKATNAGEGLNKKLTQFASLCEEKLFSDTLPLCSRYRFENLSFAPLRLKVTSVVFPRYPIPECVMLNLFQHLTGLACDLPSCKILNSSKIEWETNTHNNIIKTDFLRFQDDNAYTSPRPLWERAQSCLSRKAKATNAGEGSNLRQSYCQVKPDLLFRFTPIFSLQKKSFPNLKPHSSSLLYPAIVNFCNDFFL